MTISDQDAGNNPAAARDIYDSVNLMPLIVHHPSEVTLLGFTLTGFGLAVLLAFLIAQIVSERELTRRHHDREAGAVSDVLFAALVGTLLGAKLYYVVVITHDVRDLWTRGGFVFWGGFLGAVLVCALTIRAKHLSFARFADVAGIAISAGYAVGRTGCWAVGDDYGRAYNGPFAVAFPQGAPPSTVGEMTSVFGASFPPGMDPAQVVSVIPTQLIEVALGMAMFGVLWRWRMHKHAEGWLFGLWAVLAGIERLLVEFLRVKDDRGVFGLTIAQFIAIGIALGGLAIMSATSRPASTLAHAK